MTVDDLGGIVLSLADDGLIELEVDPETGRVMVRLTEAGRSHVETRLLPEAEVPR